MNAIHLFTFRGIPVFASPMYFLLLLMFGYRQPVQGVVWAVCITISLLVHEFGHALIARRLKHDPSVMLHGFGGLTSRSRTGRDVEEAAIVAMGPASGLALGLLVFGASQLLDEYGLVTPFVAIAVNALLYSCVVWNLLNLLPLWPLDGGQLVRLGAGRLLRASVAARLTHGLSLVMIAGLGVYALQHGMLFSLVILVMLGLQNIQELKGRAATSDTPRASSLALELVDRANDAFTRGDYKEAARLSHQARAQEGVSPAMMERIWETLGLATEQLGAHEEALAYLRRAPANERVRAATLRCLEQLGRTAELGEYQKRWTNVGPPAQMQRWLTGALAFIALAVTVVFTTGLSSLLLR